MVGRRLTLFALFGFPIRIDASWLLLAVLVVWSLGTGYFPVVVPGLPVWQYGIMGGVGLIGLASSLVAHELSHALVARHFRMRINGITLFIFGGVAELADEPPSARAEFLMAIAGPIASIIVAIVVHVTAAAIGGVAPVTIVAVLEYLAVINFILGVFNLIPAFPLDGGRCLRAGLWAWRRDMGWATKIAALTGQGLGLLLMAFGLYTVVTGSLIIGGWWAVMGLFVRKAAAQSARYHRMMHRPDLGSQGWGGPRDGGGSVQP